MTRLRRLQRELQDCLLGTANGAERHVAVAGPLSAAARLQVYADAYRLRLLEALAADFVALRAWLRTERFAELGRAYIAAHPSTHPSLRHLGRHLARFLAETPPYDATPLLAELAAFEWALGTAFDAPDEPVLERESLAALSPAAWPRLRLRIHASAVRLDLHFNAPAIRQAADAGAPALPAAAKAAQPVAWVVWRQHLATCFRSLEPDEAYAFDALRGGGRFAVVCEGLCRWRERDQVAARAAGLLDRWVADGLVRSFTTSARRKPAPRR